MLVRIFDELKPQKRFKMIDGKGKAMLVAQDQDPNKMLNGKGSQGFRGLGTISDNALRTPRSK